MAIQLSPGVNVTEIDLTTVVPSVATTDAAIAGVFRWGPIGERILVDSENLLGNMFGKPTNFNPETWLSAANFLAYGDRLWVSRAANTTGATPFSNSITVASNTFVINMDTTNVVAGMYLTQTSNASIVPAGEDNYIVSKNTSSITLSKKILAAGTVDLYFGHPETTYTAVGFDSTKPTARVANLVHQIVKNENDYTAKEGTFDTDIIYIAKYPGKLGNSLRVGICDNSNSFSSNVDLLGSSVIFNIGSPVAYVKYEGVNNTSPDIISSHIAIGDQISVGNADIGVQYMQVVDISVGDFTSNAVITVDGNSAVDGVRNFINVPGNPFVDGDVLLYQTSDNVIEGLVANTNYFVVNSNTSGFKLANTSFGNPLDINPVANSLCTFETNSYDLKITFEDPYRLRSKYVSNTINRFWEFFNVFETAPGQSTWQAQNGNTSAMDEVHLVVVDDGGLFTGVPGTVLETYKSVSRATDAKNIDGSINYYKDVINQGSNFVWWTNDRSTALSNTARLLTSSTSGEPGDIDLVLGSDGLDENKANLNILGQAWDLFKSPEDVDVSLLIQGKPVGGVTVVNGETVINYQLANYIIDNIAEVRKDCIALVSPDKGTVLNNIGREAVSLKNWRGAIRNSSYAVMDSGYKYQYDRYNDLYRWVPLNGDIAGTCVRTDNTNDAWWSPAGYNRGSIKNVIKLAFNPRKSERDILYPNGVNPVVTQPGQGTVLFGDKTLQAKPSAFDRINVRRLFIVLEKAISTAAKYSLFEFNDTFTRSQFKNLVVPYLRMVQGRRGITDFQVVCDETNNTPQIVDSNQFVGDIYIKPARSINFIQLNFIAVPSGVQFNEVIGKF